MSLEEVWVGTYTGRTFHPFAPRVEDIDPEDIAHSLANQCRFNGHCNGFYSVAEHCIWVSAQVPESARSWGLLHDAAEAYISDVVRPIKSRLKVSIPVAGDVQYDKTFGCFEEGILKVIAERFGLTWPMPESVREADDRMLATERNQLFDRKQPQWGGLDGILPYDITIPCYTPAQAKGLYLQHLPC